MSTDELVQVLRRNHILGALPDETLTPLAQEMTSHRFEAGEQLIEQDTPGDSIWVLDEGLLEIRHRHDDLSRRVGLLGKGGLVGEGALLSDNPRNADVFALRDSRVVRLDQLAFHALLREKPESVLAMVRLMLDRQNPMASLLDPSTRVVTVVPLDTDGSSSRLLDHLETAAKVVGIRSARVDESSGADRDPVELFTGGGDPPTLLFVDAAGGESWRRRAIRNADCLFLSTDPGGIPQPSAFEIEIWDHLTKKLSPVLVLVGPPPEDLLRWTITRPDSPVRLVNDDAQAQELLVEMTRGHPDLAWLQETELFGDLDPSALGALAMRFEWVSLQAGDVLFEAGSAADALFVVVGGRLAVNTPGVSGTPLGLLRTGAVIGEMAVLREGHRSASVTAVRDSVVARLTRADYESIQQAVPEIGRRLMDLALKRLLPARSDRLIVDGLVIAAIAIDGDPRLLNDARGLRDSLLGLGSTTVVDRPFVERTIGNGGADLDPGAPGEPALIDLMERLERSSEHLLLISDRTTTAWTRRCARHADVVLLFGDASTSPARSEIERALWPSGQHSERGRVVLVLVHPPGTRHGNRTARWLDERGLAQWAHIARDDREDSDRLVRRVTRRGVGLALGGGGSRGAAHLGVLRAFSERGIPIDHVSGTSAGGAIAGLVARRLPLDESTTHVEALLGGVGGHFATLGPPIISAMSGRHVQRLLEPWFDGLDIEDLPIPLSVTAADISSARAVAIERGPVWEAVRASTSVPGLWPPVVRNGLLHVDGGVLNNLPADFLEEDCRHGVIVASDVAAIDENSSPYHSDSGNHISGWRVMWEDRVQRRRRKRSTLGSTVLQSMLVSSKAQLDRTIHEHVDVLIRPELSGVGMFELRTPERISWAASRGYEAAQEALAGLHW